MIQAAFAVALLAAGPVAIRPLEVWTESDDGLTQRLADAVRNEIFLRDSHRTIIGVPVNVTILDHAKWREYRSRTEVRYSVVIEGNGKVKRATGKCWEDALRVCAVQIADAAVRARSAL